MLIVRFLLFPLTLLLIWSSLASSTAVESRIALVIGNGNYPTFGELTNPVNDMALIEATLGDLGFEVISAANLDQIGMKQVIQTFGRRLDEAGPDAVGLFYYAGHGIQSNGTNFLVPIDASIERETDIAIETVNLDWVLAQMKYASSRINIVIIDACRNNPIVSSHRSGNRGLAQVDAPRGTLIAYATAPGGIAADGNGKNSPYTLALSQNLKQPGRVLEEVFRQTRVDVIKATDGQQVPWEASSLTGAFYFAKEGSWPVAETASVPEINAAIPSPNSEQIDMLFWESIRDSDDPALYDDYLSKFPKGEFRHIAVARRKALMHVQPEQPHPNSLETEPLDTTMYVQERANIRVFPSIDAELVATLPLGTEIHLVGKVVDRDWYQVALDDGRTAFIWKPLLGDHQPVDGEIFTAAAKDLTGRWSGSYRCQEDFVGLTLDLVEQDNQVLEAVFSFYPMPDTPSFPEGSFAMEGYVDPGEKLVRLHSTDWIDRPYGLQLHDIRGQIDTAGKEITGQVLTTGCADFIVSR